MVDFTDDNFAPTDKDFEELYDFVTAEEPDGTMYNLVADADADCLAGDCDHFCGEPTQADLDRLYDRGLGHLVDAYENNIHYV
jgi:hypothetical protein